MTCKPYVNQGSCEVGVYGTTVMAAVIEEAVMTSRDYWQIS